MNKLDISPSQAAINAKDPLLQPFQIKGVTIRNRLMSTSHAITYEDDGMPKGRYQAYQEGKAAGGIGLTMFGGSTVISADSPSIFQQLNASDDRIIPYFQQMADRVHRHGAKIMCQLTHMGRRTSNYVGDWLPVIAPSRSREMLHRNFAKAMNDEDIARVIKAYAQAGVRAMEGGLDGFELMAGSHLLWQFLAPETNQRDDNYGGNFENRMRFVREVYAAVREAVGDAAIIGIRLPVGEEEGGITFDEAVMLANMLKADGTVDFVNAIWGRLDDERSIAQNHMINMDAPLAPYFDVVKSFRQAIELPVFHATRINDAGLARSALREGVADMVAMTRGHIADPNYVNKIMTGQEQRIRPCVGATYCSSPVSSCIYNPAIGREEKLSHTIKLSAGPARKIVVIGGGPGGMEAARVSALRGHNVVIFEATDQLGGQMRLASRGGWRRDVTGILGWYESEFDHLAVDIRTNVYADAQIVMAEKPDVVINATGGLPDVDWLSGGDLCHSTWDVMSGDLRPSGKVLIYDGTGDHQASSCADVLSENGCQVTMLSPDGNYGENINYINSVSYRKRFHQRGVILLQDRMITKVERVDNQLLAHTRHTLNHIEETLTVSAVIIEHGTVPLTDEFDDLTPHSSNLGHLDQQAFIDIVPQTEIRNPDGKFQLFTIGDAIVSRDAHAAIYDSLRLCCAL